MVAQVGSKQLLPGVPRSERQVRGLSDVSLPGRNVTSLDICRKKRYYTTKERKSRKDEALYPRPVSTSHKCREWLGIYCDGRVLDEILEESYCLQEAIHPELQLSVVHRMVKRSEHIIEFPPGMVVRVPCV